jgi:hypothetical protein
MVLFQDACPGPDAREPCYLAAIHRTTPAVGAELQSISAGDDNAEAEKAAFRSPPNHPEC